MFDFKYTPENIAEARRFAPAPGVGPRQVLGIGGNSAKMTP
jgi:hypothetical protein